MTVLRRLLARPFVLFVAGVTPRCREITRLLSQELDQSLPWPKQLLVRLHLTVCVWCARYGEQLQSLRAFSRCLPERGCEHGDAALPPTARARLKEALRKHAGP